MSCEGLIHRFNQRTRICICGQMVVPEALKIGQYKDLLKAHLEPARLTGNTHHDVSAAQMSIDRLVVAVKVGRFPHIPANIYRKFAARLRNLYKLVAMDHLMGDGMKTGCIKAIDSSFEKLELFSVFQKTMGVNEGMGAHMEGDYVVHNTSDT